MHRTGHDRKSEAPTEEPNYRGVGKLLFIQTMEYCIAHKMNKPNCLYQHKLNNNNKIIIPQNPEGNSK